MKVIELALDTPDGIADCRLEPEEQNGQLVYSATILYPSVVNGYSRSEIYSYTMKPSSSGQYAFAYSEDGIHPKIAKLESALVAAIANNQ